MTPLKKKRQGFLEYCFFILAYFPYFEKKKVSKLVRSPSCVRLWIPPPPLILTFECLQRRTS
jgi:hypothetical protein